MTELKSRAFQKFAWAFLGYLVAVILFGAWVRITHSGAGCGSNWPTCQGEIVPLEPSIETIIEYTHRLTSGLCGILGLVLLGWAWKVYGAHRVTRAAAATMAFLLLESALGAGLVLRDLVVDNASAARAVVAGLHLTNTLMLTACAALTAWWTGGRPALDLGAHREATRWFALGLILLILTSMSGAVTALGDTIFPIEPSFGPEMLAKLRDNLSPINHFLVRLRALHPAVAVIATVYLIWLAGRSMRTLTGADATWAQAALFLALGEFALGVVNIALAAPGWLQIVHLLAANALWVAVLLTGSAAVSRS